MIRVDGQDLQTLYCLPADHFLAGDLDWSPDERSVLFITSGSNDLTTIHLLSLVTGEVRTVYTPSSNTRLYYNPQIWFDNLHVYLSNGTGQEEQNISVALLDLSKSQSVPQQVTPLNRPYNDFALSLDKKTVVSGKQSFDHLG